MTKNKQKNNKQDEREFTVILENLNDKLDLLAEGQVGLVNRLDRIDLRLDSIEVSLGNLEIRMSAIEQRMNKLEIRASAVEKRMDNLEQKINKFSNQLEKIRQELHIISQQIKTKAEKNKFNILNKRMFVLERRLAAVTR